MTLLCRLLSAALLFSCFIFSASPVLAVRVYDFSALYRGLGYPSPDYFGSTADEVMDLQTYTSKDDTFYGEINGCLRFHPAPYEWYAAGPEAAASELGAVDVLLKPSKIEKLTVLVSRFCDN